MKQIKILLLSLLFLLSCEETAIEDDPQAATFIAEGWTAFELNNYEEAKTAFQKAFNIDNNALGSIVGLGLSFAKLSELDSALSYANLGIQKADTVASFHMAKGFILAAKTSYALSNASFDAGLAEDADWSFNTGISLGLDNVYSSKAWNFFQLGEDSDAILMIQKIDENFSSSADADAIGAKLQEYNQTFGFL